MTEAYRVGVTIALQGDITQIIGKIINEFERLDAAVNKTQEKLVGLKEGLAGLAREGQTAAAAWEKVAKSIQAASKAAPAAAAKSAEMQPREAPRSRNPSRATADASDAIAS